MRNFNALISNTFPHFFKKLGNHLHDFLYNSIIILMHSVEDFLSKICFKFFNIRRLIAIHYKKLFPNLKLWRKTFSRYASLQVRVKWAEPLGFILFLNFYNNMEKFTLISPSIAFIRCEIAVHTLIFHPNLHLK